MRCRGSELTLFIRSSRRFRRRINNGDNVTAKRAGERSCVGHDPHFDDFHCHLHDADRGIARPCRACRCGLDVSESSIVALTTLTLLILYNAVTIRLRDPANVGTQIADLSRGTTDLARQVAEFGRRIGAIEHRLSALDATSREQSKTTLGEISELGILVKQLAISIAVHDELLTAEPQVAPPQPAIPSPATPAGASATNVTPATALTTNMTEPVLPPDTDAQTLNNQQATDDKQAADKLVIAAVQKAIDTNSIDIYLQPLVTLPQRKVMFYEAVSRIRGDTGQLLAGHDFIAAAEADGLMAQIDRMVVLRSVQVLRRLMARNKDVGLFCNISAATLGNEAVFAQCLDFLEANRALAPSLSSRIQAIDPAWAQPDRERTSRGTRATRLSLLDRSCQRLAH